MPEEPAPSAAGWPGLRTLRVDPYVVVIPGAPLTNFNEGRRGGGGDSDRGSYFTPKKNHNYPKKSLLF